MTAKLSKTIPLALLVVGLVLASTAPAAAVTNDTPQAAVNNTTTTTTQQPTTTQEATTTQKACEPSNPELQQARLYTDDPTITKDSPGAIAGTITTDVTNKCPIVVQITLTVPNGMYIQGTSDVGSGGGGVVTNTMTVQPGSSQSLRASVYSNNLGSKTVTADITYFPKGHKDMARELDGQMLEFDVQEKTMPDSTNSSAKNADEDKTNALFANLTWSKALISVTVVSLLGLVALGMLSIRGAIPDNFDFDFEFRK